MPERGNEDEKGRGIIVGKKGGHTVVKKTKSRGRYGYRRRTSWGLRKKNREGGGGGGMQIKNRLGCLFIRTFFTEEFLYPLTYNAWNCIHPPVTSLICEIKTRGLILWKYQVILVFEYVFIIKGINYALWHTFESKRYMYFHNKTWYTCTRCYM